MSPLLAELVRSMQELERVVHNDDLSVAEFVPSSERCQKLTKRWLESLGEAIKAATR